MVIAAVVALAAATATPAPSLVGIWEAADRSSLARIAPCAPGAVPLCATTLKETLLPGEAPTVGKVILRDIVAARPAQWKGTYMLGSTGLPATVRLIEPDLVEMKVCRWVFCQSGRYRRIEDGR